MDYKPRVIDGLLSRKLQGKSAVLIEGPKWCGKTSTSEQQAKSVIYMSDPKLIDSYLTFVDTLPTAVPWAMIFERVDSLPRHPAQLYEALAYGVTALLLGAVSGSEAGRRKGVLAGWCLILVFGFRVVLEFFKTPQAAYEADFTLTVGQWLSVPVILAGCWLVRRRPA